GRQRDGRRGEPSRGKDARGGIDADRSQQVLAEHDGDPAEGGGAYQDELRPAEQKRNAPAPPFAQVRVEAAAVGQGGAELGKRQRAAQRDETAGGPEPEGPQRV